MKASPEFSSGRDERVVTLVNSYIMKWNSGGVTLRRKPCAARPREGAATSTVSKFGF